MHSKNNKQDIDLRLYKMNLNFFLRMFGIVVDLISKTGAKQDHLLQKFQLSSMIRSSGLLSFYRNYSSRQGSTFTGSGYTLYWKGELSQECLNFLHMVWFEFWKQHITHSTKETYYYNHKPCSVFLFVSWAMLVSVGVENSIIFIALLWWSGRAISGLLAWRSLKFGEFQ